MKIEMVVPTLGIAGMETMAASMIRGLAAQGHEVGATCTLHCGELGEQLRDEGFRVSLVPTVGLWANVHARDLTRWLGTLRPDVVHVHGAAVWTKGLRAARAARPAPIVYTMHGVEEHSWYTDAYQRFGSRYADAIIPVSLPLRDYLTGTLGVPAAKVRAIRNGIDSERFHPGPRSGEVRHRLGLRPEQPVIGIVARLEPVKNHALLIDAFALVHRRVPDAALVLVGVGKMDRDLAAQVAALGLQEHVHFWGLTDDAGPLYRDFDVCTLSSDSEGTSVSLLEAMASGCCVVATAVGGTPALLDEGRCGLLVPPRQPAALAEALLRALRDPALRGRLAEAARARVESEFDRGAMVRAYEEVYRRAMARGAINPAKESSRCVELQAG